MPYDFFMVEAVESAWYESKGCDAPILNAFALQRHLQQTKLTRQAKRPLVLWALKSRGKMDSCLMPAAMCRSLEWLNGAFPAGSKLWVALAAALGDARKALCARLSLLV